jgi:fatty-acyl-CoA synthase
VVHAADRDPASLDAPTGVDVRGWAEMLAAQPTTCDLPAIDASGTTGDPKGWCTRTRSNWLHCVGRITAGSSLIMPNRFLQTERPLQIMAS